MVFRNLDRRPEHGWNLLPILLWMCEWGPPPSRQVNCWHPFIMWNVYMKREVICEMSNKRQHVTDRRFIKTAVLIWYATLGPLALHCNIMHTMSIHSYKSYLGKILTLLCWRKNPCCYLLSERIFCCNSIHYVTSTQYCQVKKNLICPCMMMRPISKCSAGCSSRPTTYVWISAWTRWPA